MLSSIDISRITLKAVTVTFLEMHKKPTEILQPISNTSFTLLPKPVSVNEYRKYYYAVGEKWQWLDRIVMPDKELFEKINADNIEIFIFYINNEPAGYAEFLIDPKFTEIVYFGLLPGFIGKGFGKYFLQWAIKKAWSYNPEWIQLNTCTLDHLKALPNYKKAGFIPVRTEIQQRRVLI